MNLASLTSGETPRVVEGSAAVAGALGHGGHGDSPALVASALAANMKPESRGGEPSPTVAAALGVDTGRLTEKGVTPARPQMPDDLLAEIRAHKEVSQLKPSIAVEEAATATGGGNGATVSTQTPAAAR